MQKTFSSKQSLNVKWNQDAANTKIDQSLRWLEFQHNLLNEIQNNTNVVCGTCV